MMGELFKRVKEWVAVDGLLHILMCMVLMMASLLLVDSIALALSATIVASLGKEIWDMFVQKDNTIRQALHDIVCDAIGIGITLIIYAI
jgi:hypothetical protein